MLTDGTVTLESDETPTRWTIRAADEAVGECEVLTHEASGELVLVRSPPGSAAAATPRVPSS